MPGTVRVVAGTISVVPGTVRVVAGVVVGEVSVTVLQPLAGSQLVVFVSTLTVSAGLGLVVPTAISDSEGQYSVSGSHRSVALGAVAPVAPVVAVVLVSAVFGSK